MNILYETNLRELTQSCKQGKTEERYYGEAFITDDISDFITTRDTCCEEFLGYNNLSDLMDGYDDIIFDDSDFELIHSDNDPL